jgi:hypothetical protein
MKTSFHPKVDARFNNLSALRDAFIFVIGSLGATDAIVRTNATNAPRGTNVSHT